jgi:glycosyltransferase involved in cell wall biosynthesis
VHVGLNAVFLQPRFGGIETYVRELAAALLEERGDLRLTVFAKPGARPEGLPAEARVVSHPLIGRRFTSAVSEALLLGRVAAREGVDVLHSMAMTGPLHSPVPHVVTIHDLIWKDVPDSPDPVTTRVWRAVVPPIARRADRVLCVSQTTADDVVARLGVERERVDVVHEGFGASARAEPLPEADVRARFGLGDGPVVLAVAAKKPHKNLERLVTAFASVRAAQPAAVLVIPGSRTAYEERLRAEAERLGIADAVVLPDWVADGELEGLYAVAEVAVLPSLYEGFGFPILEAMARGVPVACSSVSALPEIAGDAAKLFDPRDTTQIASALTDLLADPDERAQLAERGRRRAGEFTWQDAALGTLASYERALGARGRA